MAIDFNYTEELRTGDDYRLPGCLLEKEEYLEAVRLLEDAHQRPKDKLGMYHPGSRYYSLYAFLKEKYDSKQDDPETRGRCVICGDPAESPEKPYCKKCHEALRDKFPNTQNTRGYSNWGRFCAVCHKAPVHPSMNGMCYNCYNLKYQFRGGAKLDKDVSPTESIRRYRAKRFSKQMIRGEKATAMDIGTYIEKKEDL